MIRIALMIVAAFLSTGAGARWPHGYHAHRTYGSYRSTHYWGPHDNGSTYRNVDGDTVHAPKFGPHPGSTAHCRDGSWSFSRHRRGTCSHHGGIG